jgi:hypothetical protein
MRSSLEASIAAAAAGIGGALDHVIAVEIDPPLRVVGVGEELAVDHHLHRTLVALRGERLSDLDELRGEVLRMQIRPLSETAVPELSRVRAGQRVRLPSNFCPLSFVNGSHLQKSPIPLRARQMLPHNL